jgi:uncharacterized protein DUF3175
MAARRTRRWSQKVTEGSNALDLQRGVFMLRSPRGIAQSLKRSAERSRRRESAPYRSAMNEAKDELGRLFVGGRGTRRKTSRKRNAGKSR